MKEEFINQKDADTLINYTGPVPGQSLTNSPNQKYPWESPPQLTNRREAELYVLEELTEKNRGVVESIYGPRPDRLSKSEIL